MRALIGLFALLATSLQSHAQSPQFTGIERLTNREILLKFSAPSNLNYRIDAATNQVVGTIELGNAPYGVAVDDGVVWVAVQAP